MTPETKFKYEVGTSSQCDIILFLQKCKGSKFTCKQIAEILKADPDTIRRNMGKIWPKYVHKRRVTEPGHRDFLYWAK
jgi:hypothetical protein